MGLGFGVVEEVGEFGEELRGWVRIRRTRFVGVGWVYEIPHHVLRAPF